MKDVIVLGGLNMDLIVETPKGLGPGRVKRQKEHVSTRPPVGRGAIKQLRRQGLRKAQAQ
ncbi:MAG: hypothetical protein CM1200mP39_30370 [Dehalococcoidia bacterium]|nr:MAG: hypothetical protein CM1200mP39_30370 [Dehalococcoidia bacterium]